MELAGRRLPGHFGDDVAAVEEEYRAAAESCAVLDLPERGLVSVGGPKRIDFLQRVLSNEVADLQPGAGRLATLMNTKGQLLASMRVLVDSKQATLELDQACLERAARTLEHYRVGAPVRFGRPESSVFALLGPTAPQLLEELGLSVPAAPNDHTTGRVDGYDVLVARASDLPQGTFVLYTDRNSATQLWRRTREAGARPVGRRAFDALRIEQGRPLYGFDISEENLLHETGLLEEYHSPAKGCYVGQEVVARLVARGGNVSRRLLGLQLNQPVPAGAEISSEGEGVGSVTTASVSPRLGPIAMGYLHRKAAEPGRRVSVAAAEATVVGLPFEATVGEA